VVDRLSWVDPRGRMAHTGGGRSLAYDTLVVAVGARMLVRHPLALTIDPARLDEQLHGLVQDVESGDVHSIAFVVPAGRTWLLPPYELALMTAQRAYDAQTRVRLTIVTSEDEPLGVFGKGASTGVKRLLDEAGIQVVPSASVQMPSAGRITLTTSDAPLRADRVVAMPELHGGEGGRDALALSGEPCTPASRSPSRSPTGSPTPPVPRTPTCSWSAPRGGAGWPGSCWATTPGPYCAAPRARSPSRAAARLPNGARPRRGSPWATTRTALRSGR
jgi:hypothetical protein